MTGGLYVLMVVKQIDGTVKTMRTESLAGPEAIQVSAVLRRAGVQSGIVGADRQTHDGLEVAIGWRCFAKQIGRKPLPRAPLVLLPCKH